MSNQNRNWLIVGSIAGVLVLILWGSYNGLISQQTEIERATAQLDNVYERRTDVLSNGAQILKSYAGTQKEIVSKYVEGVQQLSSAGDLQSQDAANQSASSQLGLLLSLGRVPEGVNPQAWSDFTVQVEGSNNRVSVERRNLISAINRYNRSTRVFPTNILASSLGFQEAPQFSTVAEKRLNPDVGKVLGEK